MPRCSGALLRVENGIGTSNNQLGYVQCERNHFVLNVFVGLHRILRLLQTKLNESGWVDKLHDQAKGCYFPLYSYDPASL